MRNLFFVLACGAAAMAAPATSRQASSSVSMLYGHWQVTGVAVSDTGVQALVRNDPAYMGRRLSFTPDRLAWNKPKAISTEAPCIAPTIRPTAPDGDPEARALVRRIGGRRRGRSRSAAGTAPGACRTACSHDPCAARWNDRALVVRRRAAQAPPHPLTPRHAS